MNHATGPVTIRPLHGMTTTARGYILNDWDLVCACMNHSGVATQILSNSEHDKVAADGDGYGRMTVAQLREFGLLWDWSHMRDSSEEAIIRVAAHLSDILRSPLHPNGLLTVQRLVAENGGNPMRAL